MTTRPNLAENLKLRLDTETLDRLRRLADLGDRTVQQEMRRALRKYVDDAEQLEEATA